MLRTKALALGLSLVALSAAAGDLAYVTNQNDNSLSVLDLDSGTEWRRLSVPGKPAGVAVGRPGEVYTVSVDTKSIRRHSLSPSGDDTVLAEATLDGGPIGAAFDPVTNQLFVSDWYNARIWVLDGQSLALKSTLTTGGAPAGLEVRDGILASADRDADQVSLFDTASGRLLHRITVGTRPFGLGFAPDGRLFVGNVGTNDVTVIAPATGKILATVPVGERPYGVAFAQGRAFVTNQYADTVSVIDLTSLASVTTLDVGEYPEGIDVTSDGQNVLIANWFSNFVSVIDAQTLTVTAEIPTGDGPRAFGRFIAPSGD